MTKKEFEKIISDGLADFPAYFLDKMKNVAIIVQDEPDNFQKQQLGYSSGNCILGLYEGVPQIQRYNYDKVAPDKITFFQNNIEMIANSNLLNIKQLIRETLWHEIGHHFGMTEEEIKKYQKRKT
ncbi:MAG: metallopeptidase family protein [Candidatus Paceibacterota bacterium]|jgi:predicted Zn-dependent protease with MMP-like domain